MGPRECGPPNRLPAHPPCRCSGSDQTSLVAFSISSCAAHGLKSIIAWKFNVRRESGVRQLATATGGWAGGGSTCSSLPPRHDTAEDFRRGAGRLHVHRCLRKQLAAGTSGTEGGVGSGRDWRGADASSQSAKAACLRRVRCRPVEEIWTAARSGPLFGAPCLVSAACLACGELSGRRRHLTQVSGLYDPTISCATTDVLHLQSMQELRQKICAPTTCGSSSLLADSSTTV